MVGVSAVGVRSSDNGGAKAATWAARAVALFVWALGVWVLATWTLTASQLWFGVGIAAAVGVGCVPLGSVAPPWRFLAPKRILWAGVLLGSVAWKIVRANCSLAWRVWSPSLPLRSGMVIVPTSAHSEGALTAVGLITSTIVDNQLVDVDRTGHKLQYHAVWIHSEDPEVNRRTINGPVEDLLARVMDW